MNKLLKIKNNMRETTWFIYPTERAYEKEPSATPNKRYQQDNHKLSKPET